LASEQLGDDADQWQVAEVTGIGLGELWFDVVEDGLTKRRAQNRAGGVDRYIAIPMNELPDDWGDQFLNGELEDDPYA
jgi:hypothetical protein